MKRIKGTLCKLLACTALLAISAFALLAFLPAKTETAFAEETKTYRITIDSNANSFRRAIVSRLPAADKATTIYFEYSFVSASTGKPGAFGPGSTSGIIDGGEYTEVIKGHACPMQVVPEDVFLKDFCRQDGKYVASFKIADIETALAAGESVSYDSMSLVFNANDGTTSRLDDGWGDEKITSTRYCGLFYGSGNWRATLDVRCYDDTGKDLQITTYGYAKIENMLELPEDESTLTTFSQSDSYFFSGSVERMNFGGWGTYGRNALNESENYYLDATSEKLNGKGAEGTVAVMKKSATGGNADKAQVSIGFGRTLTKEQVDLGGSLLVRLAGEYVDDWAGYSNMFPLDCNDDPSKAVSHDIGGLTLLSKGFFKNSLENGFTDFIIPNEELKKLCNEDGSFSGFQFLWNRFTDRDSGDWTLYLDKVSYVFNVTLENNGGTGETKTTVGAINGKLTAPAAPEKVGSKFTGWYSDAACENLYDFNGTVTGDITLYAGWEDYKIENFSVSVAGDIGLNFYAKLPEAETYTQLIFHDLNDFTEKLTKK